MASLTHPSGKSGEIRRSRILIVEDEAIIALDLAATLDQLGYEVVGSVDSAEACIQQAAALRPSLVLMDIRLKGPMDGIQAAETIKNLLEIPIVYLTSHSDDLTLSRAKATGPGGYVLKPFKIPELRCAIEIALHKHETELALARSEERYRNLVENSLALICTHDMEGTLLSINPAGAQALGYPVPECTGRSIADFLTAQGRAEFQAYLGMIRNNRVVRGNMHVIDRHQRRHVWLFNNCLMQQPGSAPYVLGHALDISELVDTQKALDKSLHELERRTREIDSFYHAVSHELKTPLTSAYEFVSLVLDGLAGDINPTQREYLSLARQGCSQLTHCINDLLDATRVETQKLEVRMAPLRIKDLIEQSMASVQLRTMAKKIEFQLAIEEEEILVMADGRRLTQVLLNLFSNAIRYTPERGKIRVAVGRRTDDPQFIQVSVSDTGSGIAPENLERIFERLFQAKREDQPDAEGLGLGLFISRQIIEAHGGTIRAESKLGQGATFVFFLKTGGENMDKDDAGIETIRMIPEQHSLRTEAY